LWTEALQQLSSSNHRASTALAAIAGFAAICTGSHTAADTQQGAAAAAASSSSSLCCGKQHSEQHKLQLCAGCQSVRYCSKECQQAHWRQHRKDCARAGVQRAA
jgi:hypothetical protein